MFFARLLLSAVTLSVAVGARPKWHELSEEYTFEQYVVDFEKAYEMEAEYFARKATFERRLVEVLEHNADKELTWRQGVNALSDWEDWEITKYKKGLDKGRAYRVREARGSETTKAAFDNKHHAWSSSKAALPASFDWRDQPGIVSEVKDQASCGSCWSFAATEVMESNVAMETGTLLTLAPQEFVDCATNPDKCGGTGGCEGATAEIAFSTATDRGLYLEADRPYRGVDGQCTETPAPVANVTGFVVLPKNEYEPLLKAVATVGPVAVSVDAAWTFYEEGVFPANRGGTDIDHAVVLVGYGHDLKSGLDYWTIRNSWGPAWGEDGYIRLERQAEPNCAIDYYNSDGVGCDGDPQEVTVCGTSAILYDCSYPTGGYLL